MQKISLQLDEISANDNESIDSDRFRSINQIFSQIKNDTKETPENNFGNNGQQVAT